MSDVGASELLLTAIVAIVLIGPKDLPRALRVAGKVIGKIRQVSNQFRTGFESAIREAEMDDMERKWAERHEVFVSERVRSATVPSAVTENKSVTSASDFVSDHPAGTDATPDKP